MNDFLTIEEVAERSAISRTTAQVRVREKSIIPDGWLNQRGAYFSAQRVLDNTLSIAPRKPRKIFGLLDLVAQTGLSLRTITNMRKEKKFTEDGYLGKYPYWSEKSVKTIVKKFGVIGKRNDKRDL